MTRDYAKQSRTPKKKSKPNSRKASSNGAPGWVWLLAGVLLGMLIMTLTELAKISPEEATKAATATTEEEPGDNGNKPRFDFYTLLRESEVIVPDAPPETTPAAQAQSDSVFVLQVGSFKNHKDADSLRARLILLNLTAGIETVSPRRGETWHRVLVGPFGNNSEVAAARNKLATSNIDSLLLKRKK